MTVRDRVKAYGVVDAATADPRRRRRDPAVDRRRMPRMDAVLSSSALSLVTAERSTPPCLSRASKVGRCDSSILAGVAASAVFGAARVFGSLSRPAALSAASVTAMRLLLLASAWLGVLAPLGRAQENLNCVQNGLTVTCTYTTTGAAGTGQFFVPGASACGLQAHVDSTRRRPISVDHGHRWSWRRRRSTGLWFCAVRQLRWSSSAPRLRRPAR